MLVPRYRIPLLRNPSRVYRYPVLSKRTYDFAVSLFFGFVDSRGSLSAGGQKAILAWEKDRGRAAALRLDSPPPLYSYLEREPIYRYND